MDYEEKVDNILLWALNKKGRPFDTSFIDSLKEYYETRGEFTISQENAIDNIYEKFRVQKWIEKQYRSNF
jgi:hypothetical protein